MHSHSVRRIDFICEALDLALLGCRVEKAWPLTVTLTSLSFSFLSYKMRADKKPI